MSNPNGLPQAINIQSTPAILAQAGMTAYFLRSYSICMLF